MVVIKAQNSLSHTHKILCTQKWPLFGCYCKLYPEMRAADDLAQAPEYVDMVTAANSSLLW